jgi:hypothetical protein
MPWSEIFCKPREKAAKKQVLILISLMLIRNGNDRGTLAGRLSLQKGEGWGEGSFHDTPRAFNPSSRSLSLVERGSEKGRMEISPPWRELLLSELLQSVSTDNPRTPALKSLNW